MENKHLIVIGILLIIIVFFTVLIITGLNTSEETISINNMNIRQGDFDSYYLVGDITAKKDFDYLEARVIFYDKNNTTIGSCPIAWNMLKVKAGENISIDNVIVTTVSGVPDRAVISFYDSVGSDKVLVNFTVHFNNTNNSDNNTDDVVDSTPVVNTDNTNKDNNDKNKYSKEDLELAKQKGYWEGYDDSLNDNYYYIEDDDIETGSSADTGSGSADSYGSSE